jgi:HrpA-like RNA helicase
LLLAACCLLLATCHLLLATCHLRLATFHLLLQDLAKMPGAARWHLLPLHGELPAAEQSKVFAPPPRGQRKVALCTNVVHTVATLYLLWL